MMMMIFCSYGWAMSWVTQRQRLTYALLVLNFHRICRQ